MFQSFTALITICFVAAFFTLAQGQTPVRVGILVQEMERAQSQALKGLSAGLKELGYQERKNLFFETRNVKGNRTALQPAAAELLARNVTVIFTTGTSATRAAMAATREIPIVFIHPGDPIAAGLVKSTGDREKNLTGVAAYSASMTEQRLVLFKEIFSELPKLLVFYDATNTTCASNFPVTQAPPKQA